MCGDSWQKAGKEVPEFASSSSVLWAQLTPSCPLYVFGQRGTAVCRPFAPRRVPAESGSASSRPGGPGEGGRERDSEKTGNRAPRSPRAGTPSPGHPPQPPPEAEGHICALWAPLSRAGSPGWRSLGAPGGAWSLVADSFLHTLLPSLPAPKARFHPLSRERTRALPGAAAPGTLMTRLGGGHAALTRRNFSRQKEPASPEVWLGVGGQSVRIIRERGIRT